MQAEIMEITKRKDGIFVVVQCGDKRETTVFNSLDATEANITKFAEWVQTTYDRSQVPMNDSKFNALLLYKGKKFDKQTKSLK